MTFFLFPISFKISLLPLLFTFLTNLEHLSRIFSLFTGFCFFDRNNCTALRPKTTSTELFILECEAVDRVSYVANKSSRETIVTSWQALFGWQILFFFLPGPYCGSTWRVSFHSHSPLALYCHGINLPSSTSRLFSLPQLVNEP